MLATSIPPKYSVAQVIGYIGEECDPHRSRVCGPAPELRTLPRGYYVSTVGQDERVVREYVQQQEREDRRLEQLRLEE